MLTGNGNGRRGMWEGQGRLHRAIARISSEAEKLSAIEIGSSGDKTPCLDAALAFDRVESDQVEGDVFEDGEVMGGMAGTGPHLVIGKGDVHAPVQLILHGPMASHGLCQAFCIGRQATDVETLLKGRFSIDTAFRFDHRKGL